MWGYSMIPKEVSIYTTTNLLTCTWFQVVSIGVKGLALSCTRPKLETHLLSPTYPHPVSNKRKILLILHITTTNKTQFKSVFWPLYSLPQYTQLGVQGKLICNHRLAVRSSSKTFISDPPPS